MIYRHAVLPRFVGGLAGGGVSPRNCATLPPGVVRCLRTRAAVAVDATIVSPIARDGTRQPRADVVPGTVLRNAANRKRRQTYPELGRSRRCRLIVFGVEVGGRWAPEVAAFLRMLARARAASAPPALRPAAQRALASSLPELPSEAHDSAAGTEPALHELLADARWHEGPAASRMPHRA